MIRLAESTCPSNIVYTAQTVIDNYLLLPKVLLKFVQFGNPRPVRQIDTGFNYITIPVVLHNFWTTGCILRTLRYELYFRSFSTFAIAITKACAKQFCSSFTSTILLLRCAITENGLLLLVIVCFPNPTGILPNARLRPSCPEH